MHDDFRKVDFQRFFASYAISLFGSLLASGIVGWLAVTHASVSGSQLGLLLACSSVTAAVVGVTIGSRIDGWSKKRVMVCVDLVAAFALVTLVAAISTGRLTLLHLGIVSAVELSAGVLFTSASMPLLKVIAGSRLDWATGRQESVFWLAQLLGPAIGGVLTSTIGAQWTLTGNAVSFIASAALVWRIEAAPVVPGTAGAAATDLRGRARVMSGAREIWRIPTLRLLYFNSMLFGVSVMAATPVITLFMLDDLRLEAWTYGLVLGLPCAGGVIAGFVSNRFLKQVGRRRLLVSAGIARTFWLLPLAAIPAGSSAVVLLILIETLFLFCAGLFNPVYSAVRIRICPQERLGAVISTMAATSRITQPAGMLGAGVLLDAIGTRPTLIAAGTLCLLSGTLLWFVREVGGQADAVLTPAAVESRATGDVPETAVATAPAGPSSHGIGVVDAAK